MNNLLPGIPLVESPLFSKLVEGVPDELKPIAKALHDEGFAVIDFPLADFEDTVEELKKKLTPQFDWKGWRLRKSKGRDGGLRLQDAARNQPDVAQLISKLAANQEILSILSVIYGRRAFPFQTLTFPVGTEQHFHTDALHFSSLPEKFMCGVWVALEDIGETQGPLVYYPGSHKLPTLWPDAYLSNRHPPSARTQQDFEPAWREIVDAMGIAPRVFTPRKGQALIWAANLLHGGLPHRDFNRTRWSHVTHYYFDGCTYVTPIFSDPLEARFELKDVVDLSTGKAVEHQYLGQSLNLDPLTVASHKATPKLPKDFKASRYLALNKDVANAGVDAREHYLTFGFYEGRRYK